MSLVARLSSTFAQIAADIKGCVKSAQVPAYKDASGGTSYTMTAADSGIPFVWNGDNTDATVIIGSTLPDGWNAKLTIVNTGKLTISCPGLNFFGSTNSASQTLVQMGSSVIVTVMPISYGGGAPIRSLLAIFDTPLPMQYVENAAAFTRNVTAMSAVPGVTLPMNANAVYDVNVLVQFTSAIITNSLKVGFLALPTGATCWFEVTIWTSDTAGGTPNWRGIFTTSAKAVAGLAGNASATGVTMIASIKGRVRTGTTAGNLALACGALSATGAQTVAAGAASMSLQKIN